MRTLRDEFGDIDIYLFDQLLRGRIAPGAVVFDAGCGVGRNLTYLMRAGHTVFGIDENPRAIEDVRHLAYRLAPSLPAENFQQESIETHSFPDLFADVVLSSAVLHFAHDDAHFHCLLRGSWRALKPGGLFFCRLASTIGMESRMKPLGGRRFLLPDGSARFLVDELMLIALTDALGGTLIDPIKTTVVQDQRSMTTWVVRRDED